MKGKSIVLENCINLAISGVSFSTFDNPSMQIILKKAEDTTTVSANLVREGIKSRAKEMRQQLKAKLKERRLSISADFGNKNGVDFFGKWN